MMTERKPEVLYPVDWEFRIVLEEAHCANAAIFQTVLTRFGQTSEVRPGNLSSSGKYRTWHAPARLLDRAMMDAMDREFRSVEGVKIVL